VFNAEVLPLSAKALLTAERLDSGDSTEALETSSFLWFDVS
jgi:hypothetical protein